MPSISFSLTLISCANAWSVFGFKIGSLVASDPNTSEKVIGFPSALVPKTASALIGWLGAIGLSLILLTRSKPICLTAIVFASAGDAPLASNPRARLL